MDFDDLLVNWKLLLEEHADIAEVLKRRFRYILVDEYQDTNKLQADVVDGMAAHRRNVMVVGDDAQSIYSFRGASFENIITFPIRFSDAVIYKLETNYRSTPQILQLANHTIAHNRFQFQKELRAVRGDGPEPAVVGVDDVFEQASFVAQRILELRDEGEKLNDIAVLYRSHYQSLELQMELSRRMIPYEIRSGVRFFEQAHIKDVIAYLKIMTNPRDELSWKRVLKLYPKIGEKTASEVWVHISRDRDPLGSFLREGPRMARRLRDRARRRALPIAARASRARRNHPNRSHEDSRGAADAGRRHRSEFARSTGAGDTRRGRRAEAVLCGGHAREAGALSRLSGDGARSRRNGYPDGAIALRP